jgi:hypothetical protein
MGRSVTKVENLRELLVTVNGLLDFLFISEGTRQQLTDIKTDLENELRFILAQQSAAQAAS